MRRQLLVYSLIVILIASILFATNFKLLGGISQYEGSDNAIHVMNADGSSLRCLTDYGNIEKAIWSPDSSKIAFLFNPKSGRADNSLYLMSADGSHKRKLCDISGSVEGFAWSPDSSQIVFSNRVIDDSHSTSRGNQSTYKINIDGTNLRKIIDEREVYLIKWSPDGSKIAYRAENNGRHELYTVSPDGSKVTQITDFSSYRSNIIPILYWSPDGSRIAFSTTHQTNELYIINSDGSNLVKIVSDDGHRGVTGWTPDSSKVLFLHFNSGEMDVHKIDTDGSNETNLTANLDDFIVDPMLSPDGQKLLFSSDRNDRSDNGISNLDIYTMNIYGSALTQLTHCQHNNYRNEGGIWSPDGSKILFFTFRNSTVSW